FRAPKSVSLAWAFADQEVADEILAGHEAAVEAAVSYLEREAARTRRGAGGTERVEVDGLIAAAFPHRTSRAGDPLLHTHVLAANLARTSDDGKWRTLESRRIYLHAKTAGVLYQAQLRHELTERLGVGWGPVHNGYADIDGIDRELIDAFSTRRRQILERLDERGESSARAAQVATLETRTPKGEQLPEVELKARWAEQARQLGHDPQRVLARVLRGHQQQLPDVDGLVRELVDEEGLTEKASTFARRDLLQAVAERLPDGASVEQVEAVADSVLEAGRDRLVKLGRRRGQLSAVDAIRTSDGRIIAGDEIEPRMTTRRLLLAEQHAINTSLVRQREGAATVNEGTVEAVLADRPSMTPEQTAMLRRLTSDGDGVTVVVGRAGTGKTFTLDAARDAWTRAGIDVHGVALAARAARELEDASGIGSTTIHRLLHQIEVGPGSPLRPGSVLVVDEAGMVGTRQLARLLDHAAQQRVKVVLVGDPRQLPEIDAGGLFGQLAKRLDAVRLVDNRRQQSRWEIDALDLLRHGDPADALWLYDAHGRLVTADTAEGLRERLVSDWWHARHQVGADQAVMIALRQADVDDLNHRARLRMHATGQLTGPTLEAGGVEFRAGDRILCLRNDRRVGVVNGTFATITDIDGRDLLATDDQGELLRLPQTYLDAGHVAHGYAITGHKAQGLTVDQAFVLGSDRLYREWGYVALSRGRTSNRLYVHAAAVDPHGITHGHQQPPDPHQQTVAGLRRSAAKTPAVEHLVVDEKAELRLELRRRGLARKLDHHHTRHAELRDRQTKLHDQISRIEADTARLQARRDELGGLGRLRKTVRDEIAGLDHQLDNKRFSLDRAIRELTSVDRQLDDLTSRDAEVRDWKRQFNEVEVEIERAAAVRARQSIRQPPGYVLTSIGGPPEDPAERERWVEAVKTLESYRVGYGIHDTNHPLGHPGLDPGQAEARRITIEALTRALPHGHQLEREPARQHERGLGRSLGRRLTR
ncbi:MAG: MobF family relaxase, partial [Nitriliruptorales bacterium]|nr:MobF family relaxase [Nitriliruptorales bacterium]